MIEHIRNSLSEAQAALENLTKDNTQLRKIEKAAAALISSVQQGSKVFSCGNGGSMSDAMHFAEELTARYRKNRAGLPAIAISDPAHITCVANDFGYEFIFSRYLESHGKEGDCLVAFSTSGGSKNIIRAVQAARKLKMTSVILTGRYGSELDQIADISIVTPSGEFADRVQELHIKIIHIIIELMERELFPQNY